MDIKSKTIQQIREYPMSFPNATAVYDQFFYVVGNGFEWKGGEITDGRDEPMSIADCIAGVVTDYLSTNDLEVFRNKAAAKVYNYILLDRIGLVVECIRRIMEAEKRAEDFSVPEGVCPYERGFEFYPISPRHSLGLNIPDNVKPDWKDGFEKIERIRKEFEEIDVARSSIG